MPGEVILFPKTGWVDKEARNKYIRVDYSNGYTVQDLSDTYKLSPSQIYKILESGE